MSEILDGAGVPIAYRRQGRGPAVVLVHGMAADALTWAPLAAALADRACVVTFDRRGYGASGAPEPYERTTVQEQAEDLAALLRELAPGAVVLGGADFGALVCLEVALRHPLRLAGLALFEPYAFNLVAAATEALSAQRPQLEQSSRGRRAAPRARASYSRVVATVGAHLTVLILWAPKTMSLGMRPLVWRPVWARSVL